MQNPFSHLFSNVKKASKVFASKLPDTDYIYYIYYQVYTVSLSAGPSLAGVSGTVRVLMVTFFAWRE